jgi:hypothetical protein
MIQNSLFTLQMVEVEIHIYRCLTEAFVEIICREMDHLLLELIYLNSSIIQNQWYPSACNLLPIFTNQMAKAEIGTFWLTMEVISLNIMIQVTKPRITARCYEPISQSSSRTKAKWPDHHYFHLRIT